MMAPDQLDRYRQAVACEKTGQSLVELLETMRAVGIETGGHDSLKSAPRGYAKDHPRIDLLRQKGLVSWKQWPPGAWLGKPGAKARVVEFLRASGPLRDWLEVNVGASTLEEPSRY